MIAVRSEDFDVGREYEQLRRQTGSSGAIVMFSGLVREFDGDSRLTALSLEHYPGMTEKSLRHIVEQAQNQWRVEQVRVIHRVGKLKPTDQIVFVGVASAHRQDAFNAAQFIMDFLKTRAPFWKKEFTSDGERWVEAKATDDAAAERWR